MCAIATIPGSKFDGNCSRTEKNSSPLKIVRENKRKERKGRKKKKRKGGKKREKPEVLDRICSHIFSFFRRKKKKKREEKKESRRSGRSSGPDGAGVGPTGRTPLRLAGGRPRGFCPLYFSVKNLGCPSKTALAGLGSQQHGASRCPRALCQILLSRATTAAAASRREGFGRGLPGSRVRTPSAPRTSSVPLFLAASRLQKQSLHPILF